VDRAELLQEIDAAWGRLNSVVSALEPEEWERQVHSDEARGEPWSVKDTVIHLAAWKRNGLRVAIGQQAGEPPEDRYPTEILGLDRDAFNKETWEKWREAPIEAVLAEHRAAHGELRAVVALLPEERVLLEGRPRHWLRPLLTHPEDHLEAQIRPALERSIGSAPGPPTEPTSA
jgi:hypothetical protein